MAEVVYLTGAPATGKSTLTRALKVRIPDLQIFEFGERLTARLTDSGQVSDQADLRSQSARAITLDDVRAVDRELLDFVATNRATNPVIMDSHAVTKESYGYRVTPYSLKEFEKLGPTQIWVLYTAPEVARQRIIADAQGRPQITEEEARFHTQLQASVAITYGMHLGTAIHFFDSAVPREQLVDQLVARLLRP
jgi:adenylate kinase